MLQPTPGSPRDLLGVGCWWFFMFGRHIHKWLLYLFHKGFPERYMYVCIHYVYIHTFFKKWRHVLGTSSKFPHCWCQKFSPKKAKGGLCSPWRPYWQWTTPGIRWRWMTPPPPQTRDFTAEHLEFPTLQKDGGSRPTLWVLFGEFWRYIKMIWM